MLRIVDCDDFIARQLDFDLVDYVTQLREGILEAYTGVVTGFKNTDQGMPPLSVFPLRSPRYLFQFICYFLTRRIS